MHKHRAKKQNAKNHEVMNLTNDDTKDFDLIRRRADGVVDDPLWQLKCQVKKGKKQECEKEKGELLAL